MEVDDILKEWTWRQPFDLIHLRQMIAAFTREEWAFVYQQCFQYGLCTKIADLAN